MGTPKLLRLKVAERNRLYRAWMSVQKRASRGSHGVDKQSVNDFSLHQRSELNQLRDELRSDTYKPSKYRGFAISKSGLESDNPKDHRPISVATVRDRIVQRATLDAIWIHIRDAIHTESSYGGIRPYKIRNGRIKRESRLARNVKSAAQRIIDYRKQGLAYVFETDIEKFYPSINRDRLFRILDNLLPDDSLTDVFQAALDTSISNISEMGPLHVLWDERQGVPQGGVLSPVMANLYLSEFDNYITNKKLAMTRYVDDLIIQCTTQRDAEEAYAVVQSQLGKLQLSIHGLNVRSSSGRIKTRIVGPGQPFEFLGLEFCKTVLRPSKGNQEKLAEKLRTLTDARRFPASTMLDVLENCQRVISGWLAAYEFCNITKSELNRVDSTVRRYIGGWMQYHRIIKNWKTLDITMQHRLGLRIAARHPFRPIM